MDFRNVSSIRLESALLQLDQEAAEEIIFEVGKNGAAIHSIGELISITLKHIGDSWEKGELSLSQVYMCGVICEKIIDKVLPPQSPERMHQPKTAIAVFEDFHLLGKRIVYSTLRASGIELLDLGGGQTIENLVRLVKQEEIKILLISVLMLPSALRIKDLMKELEGIDVKVVVGGAPFRFDTKLAQEIGVDYVGKDSAEALEIVSNLMEEVQ